MLLRNDGLAGPDSNGRSCHIARYDGEKGYNFKWQVAGRIGRLPQHQGKLLARLKLICSKSLSKHYENMFRRAAMLF
jgi:hypothetical protein